MIRRKSRFISKYEIRVSDANKDGGILWFTIKSRQVSVKRAGINAPFQFVQRSEKDFDSLIRVINQKQDIGGIIVPSAKIGLSRDYYKKKENETAAQKYSNSDLLQKDSRLVERSLHLIAAHPILSSEPLFERFLTAKLFVCSQKIRPSLPRAPLKTFLMHRDCEDYIQKQKEWQLKSLPRLDACMKTAWDLTRAQQGVCCALSSLDNKIMVLSNILYSYHPSILKQLCKMASKTLLAEKKYALQRCYEEETTLISCIEFNFAYMIAMKDMLARRCCMQIQYETANREVGRIQARSSDVTSSKSRKEVQALEKQRRLQTEFKECSDRARDELKDFHLQRVALWRESLVALAQCQLQCTRDARDALALCLAEIRSVGRLPTRPSASHASTSVSHASTSFSHASTSFSHTAPSAPTPHCSTSYHPLCAESTVVSFPSYAPATSPGVERFRADVHCEDRASTKRSINAGSGTTSKEGGEDSSLNRKWSDSISSGGDLASSGLPTSSVGRVGRWEDPTHSVAAVDVIKGLADIGEFAERREVVGQEGKLMDSGQGGCRPKRSSLLEKL